LSKSRENYSTEEKAPTLNRHLLDKESVSDLCDDIDIGPIQFYR
jgi:transposase-like protein